MRKPESKKTRAKKPTAASELVSLNRRAFVRLVPTLTAAALVVPHLRVPAALAQVPSPTPLPMLSPTPSPTPTPVPLRVTKDMLRQTEKLIGIELSDAQEAMALPNVNTNLERYETLRKINIPLDTEPATLFHPALPGKKFNVKAAKFKLTRAQSLQFSSLEDLAFATLPQLAELIRTRKVSPVDLTKMYVARLKKYGPKLNCVVTLTEDLALAQAAAADREIRAG
jgi:hypothetical protein